MWEAGPSDPLEKLLSGQAYKTYIAYVYLKGVVSIGCGHSHVTNEFLLHAEGGSDSIDLDKYPRDETE